MLLTFIVQLFNTNYFMSVCFNNMNTTDTSFCQNKSVCRAPPENKRPEERNVENDKLGRNGKTIVRSLWSPVAWLKSKQHGQGWCETFSNFCRLKSSSSLKEECRGGIFCGTRPSLCQRHPVGTSTLHADRQMLCQAYASTENETRDHCSILAVPLLMGLHHTQT